MASEVDIANVALTLLGESRIVSLNDAAKPARELKALFSITRDALLGGYNWNFAMARASLSPLADAPEFGYTNQFQMPVDCLRVVLVAEVYVGVDISDLRSTPVDMFAIEGRKILTDLESPLRLRYVKRVTDTSQFDPCFVMAFGAKLAYDACEAITNTGTKKDRCLQQFNSEIGLAVRSNAIQLPPKKLPDDEWVESRQ